VSQLLAICSIKAILGAFEVASEQDTQYTLEYKKIQENTREYRLSFEVASEQDTQYTLEYKKIHENTREYRVSSETKFTQILTFRTKAVFVPATAEHERLSFLIRQSVEWSTDKSSMTAFQNQSVPLTIAATDLKWLFESSTLSKESWEGFSHKPQKCFEKSWNPLFDLSVWTTFNQSFEYFCRQRKLKLGLFHFSL
jgi:hypothetical protein